MSCELKIASEGDVDAQSCPWCEVDLLPATSWWAVLGDDEICPQCGQPIELEMEEDYDNIWFWFTKRSTQLAAPPR